MVTCGSIDRNIFVKAAALVGALIVIFATVAPDLNAAQIDGAALYSPQALWTAARENLPVTFVVVNNREYNILKHFMKAQPHYASVRADRFIAMDIVKPDIPPDPPGRA